MKRGIDISKWQGTIDFSKVKDAGIEFVIARSSYRRSVDPRFREYVAGCKAVGIPVIGVYHFMYALNEASALEEAMFCIEQVKNAGLDENTYIFCDFEYDTVRNAADNNVILGKAECNKFTRIFCECVRSLGYQAGIYTNIDYYKNWYDKELLNDFHTWLADYNGEPDYSCIFQQITSSGKVNGINGKVDMDYFYGMEETEMSKSRQAVVDLMLSWEGKNEADGSHKAIIDIYNSYNGTFPRGTKMKYDWAWCACTWSAVAIKLGYTDIMPIEISCGYLIDAAKKMGIWQENDGYVAKPGDAVLYDWADSGKGDNTGWPDHVGTVVEVHEDAGYYVVMEGNYNNAVKKRTLSINGLYIRGFITPKYDDDVVIPPSQTAGKDAKTIAHEVIAGVWGNGDKRKKALEAAGYDYEEIRKLVNQILNGDAVVTTKPEQNQSQPTTKKVTATCAAKRLDGSLSGTYKTTANLHLRNDAGTNKKSLCVIPTGTEVRNYGYYTVANNVKWLYIQVAIDGVLYTGFSSSAYLKR